jgi:hypothetical protein
MATDTMLRKPVFIIFQFFLFFPQLSAQQTPPLTAEQQFLRYQIESATAAELSTMATEAGLPAQESPENLRRALLAHYNLPVQEPRPVTIVNADTLYNGPVTGLGDDITRLAGNVHVSLDENGTEHHIRADFIEIDNISNTIFASGNVRYTVGPEENRQYFSAAYMIFESKTYTGIVVSIQGESVIEGEEEESTLYYTAEKLQKATDDLILLDDVVVTSCNADDPHYHVSAGRIWKLGDNEWAAKNLWLYLGRVPVFYLPFYYQGDVLLFNPVIGYKWREGAYINTTSYLIGGKSVESGIFNLNILSSGQQREADPLRFKILLDYYNRLGLFTGIGLDIEKIHMESIAGLAFSRTITSSGHLYSAEGDYNPGYLYGRRLPFRYGLKADGSYENLSFSINLYSDPFFVRDFFNRSENGFLFSFINTNTLFPYDELTQNSSYIRYKKNFSFNNPAINYFNIDYFNIELYESAKTDASLSIYDPHSSFFAPTLINLPNTRFSLGARWPVGASAPAAGDNTDENDGEEPSAADQNERWQQAFFYDMIFREQIYSTPETTQWSSAADVRPSFSDIRSYSANATTVGYTLQTASNFFNMTTALGFYADYQQRFSNDDDRTQSELTQDALNRNLILSHKFELNYAPFYTNERLKETRFSYKILNNFFNNRYDTNLNEHVALWGANATFHEAQAVVKYDRGFWWSFIEGAGSLPPLDLKGRSRTGAGLEFFYLSNELYLYSRLTDLPTSTGSGYGIRSAYTPVSFFTAGQVTEFDFGSALHYSQAYLQFFGLKAAFTWEKRYLYTWDASSLIWLEDRDAAGSRLYGFIPSTLNITFDQDIPLPSFWHNRITPSLNLKAGWLLDWQLYNESEMTAGLGFSFLIYKVLELSLSINSINRSSFLYIPFMREKLGITSQHSFWKDLGASLNFFSASARQNSPFKLENIELRATLDLHDWTMNLLYQGAPQYDTRTDSVIFNNIFSFIIAWKPAPSIKAGAKVDEGLWSLG